MADLTLTLDQFGRLCSVLGLSEDEGLAKLVKRSLKMGSFEERRGTPRIECRKPVRIALTRKSEMLPAEPSTLRDISTKGLTLSHTKPIKAGTRVVIFVGESDNPIRVIGTVAHCKVFSDGVALTGITYENFIDPVGQASTRLAS